MSLFFQYVSSPMSSHCPGLGGSHLNQLHVVTFLHAGVRILKRLKSIWIMSPGMNLGYTIRESLRILQHKISSRIWTTRPQNVCTFIQDQRIREWYAFICPRCLSCCKSFRARGSLLRSTRGEPITLWQFNVQLPFQFYIQWISSVSFL